MTEKFKEGDKNHLKFHHQESISMNILVNIFWILLSATRSVQLYVNPSHSILFTYLLFKNHLWF